VPPFRSQNTAMPVFPSLNKSKMQVFGQAAFEAKGKYFRLLHFTSEQTYGDKDQRAVLRFSFRLPPVEQMQEVSRLVSAVGVFVDVVGNYKLSPDQRKRAEKVSLLSCLLFLQAKGLESSVTWVVGVGGGGGL